MRILPFLDPAVIRNNPKILMGYSDTTTLLTYCLGLGLVTFHGPSIMAGFSQMASLGDGFGRHLRSILFDGGEGYAYTPYPSYHEGYPDWSEPGNI